MSALIRQPRVDGTIVIGGDRSLRLWLEPPSRKDRSPDSVIGKRITLPAGRRKLLLRDRSYECAPVVVDIPSGSDLAYLSVTSKESDDVKRCRAVDIKRLGARAGP